MGDYGFEGAAEFGGQDINFNCEPDGAIKELGDFCLSKCPNREFGLRGDADDVPSCLLTGRSDVDQPYNKCDFTGKDYRACPKITRFQEVLAQTS